MKIANIVYADELVNHKEVDYINYFKGEITTDLNTELPTLFVGWGFIKEFEEIPELRDINILKHRIVENKLYWEFSFDENKSSHVKGVNSFVKNAPDFYFTPRYNYTNLDPVFYMLKDTQDLFDVLPKEIDAIYDYKGEMFYVLKGDQIWGLDARMYHFFKFDTAIIWNKLVDRTKYEKISDIGGVLYQKYYKQFPEFTLLKRYLVVLVTN